MNDLFQSVGLVTGGGLIGWILTYLTLSSKLRKYIEEVSGKKEERDVNVKGGTVEIRSVAIFADKKETLERFHSIEENIEAVEKHFDAEIAVLRREAKRDFEAMRLEAVEGRRRIHERIEEIPQKVINLLRDTKGLIS